MFLFFLLSTYLFQALWCSLVLSLASSFLFKKLQWSGTAQVLPCGFEGMPILSYHPSACQPIPFIQTCFKTFEERFCSYTGTNLAWGL